MNIIDKIKQKREEKNIRKIQLRKATREEQLQWFEKSLDKKQFIQKVRNYLEDEIADYLKGKMLEICKNDKDFLVDNLPDICRIFVYNSTDLKEIMMSQLTPDEIVSNVDLFSNYGYAYDQMDLLKNVNSKLITSEIFAVLPQDYQEQFIGSMKAENVTSEMLNVVSEDFKISLFQNCIGDDSIQIEFIKNLFSENTLEQYVKEIVQKNPTKLNDRCFEFVQPENKGKIIALAKINYALQKIENDKNHLYHPLQEMMNKEEFIRYFEYRQENFNIGENQDETKYFENKTNRNTAILEVLSSMNEYNNNSELINKFLNSDKANDDRFKLLLRYYILDGGTKEKVTNIDELLKYPNDVLKIQMKLIATDDGNISKDIVIKNLTGFSLEEYQNYNNMFLESHDIEDILKANGGNEQKLTNIKIVREIIELMETMDTNQLREFATNITTRNYNELVSGEFSLVSLRENYKTFISNIKSEYGKEINQSLGYIINNTESIEWNGKKVNVHEIEGAFKFLIHANGSYGINNVMNSNYNMVNTSLISEGHYEIFKKAILDDRIHLIYDNIPEEFLYASGNHDIDSNDSGDTKSNFMTTEHTIQAADSVQDQEQYTDQVYYMQGFDKEGKFITVYPKALGVFGDVINETTLSLATKYNLDIIKIPEMQTNLEKMLEDGIVTPGLIKGIKGCGDKIIQILSSKEILSKEERLSLELLQKKENDKKLSSKIEELLQKPIAKRKEDMLGLIDDINISQINSIANETRQIINIINSPEMNRGD